MAEFFEPVDDWITEYVKDPADVTSVDLVEYFNSASARVFITLFQKITWVSLRHKKFIFNWYYEDGTKIFSNAVNILPQYSMSR